MIDKVDTAFVELWGDVVGAVAWLDDQEYAVFEFDSGFLKKGLDVSPVHMSLDTARRGNTIFSFPALGRETFLGLPGMLADALPDKFGNAIIDAWLARQGRNSADFSPVERLCYSGKRAMGALEFRPPAIASLDESVPVEVAELVELAQTVVAQRMNLDVDVSDNDQQNAEAILDILRVGTSAGGARAKAVIAMDEQGSIRSGQTSAPVGYDYWILKFDGVSDLELGAPQGYGRIEFAYYLMAQAAGIDMSECRLLEESGRAHFLTRRFDRVAGRKIHQQSLCGLAHFDFNLSGAYGYEQAFAIMRQLRLSKADMVQQYRRMVFNVITRNQDDHSKNIAYLMDDSGKWQLSPAFDVTYAHNPAGQWTNQHQMSINGKRDDFTRDDLLAVAQTIGLRRPGEIIDDVLDIAQQWPEFAKTAGVPKRKFYEYLTSFRFDLR